MVGVRWSTSVQLRRKLTLCDMVEVDRLELSVEVYWLRLLTFSRSVCASIDSLNRLSRIPEPANLSDRAAGCVGLEIE